ncbi:MAG: hypothetical protein ACFCU9_08285 [Cyanophyceae cyanobacterium]
MKGKLTREQTLFRRTRLQLTAWYVGVMGAPEVAQRSRRSRLDRVGLWSGLSSQDPGCD